MPYDGCQSLLERGRAEACQCLISACVRTPSIERLCDGFPDLAGRNSAPKRHSAQGIGASVDITADGWDATCHSLEKDNTKALFGARHDKYIGHPIVFYKLFFCHVAYEVHQISNV